MTCTTSQYPLARFDPPYRSLAPMPDIDTMEARVSRGLPAGKAIVWNMAAGDWNKCFARVRNREPGTALIVILPPAIEGNSGGDVLLVVERCQPHSVLPYHPEPRPDELEAVLRRVPSHLPEEVTDYLMWRGVTLDLETRQMVRKIIKFSSHLSTVTGVARGLYMSRRALGRHFLTRGLPAPSHWIQFSRVLRAGLSLHESSQTLFTVATEFGFSDGFALSNQMYRLLGIRPSKLRSHAGWEWVVESWLQAEVLKLGFSPVQSHLFQADERCKEQDILDPTEIKKARGITQKCSCIPHRTRYAPQP